MPSLTVHYLGHQPQEIRSGGDRYINDVLIYLDKSADLKIWDSTDSQKFQQEVPFRFSLRALRAVLYWNLWAIRSMWKLQKTSIILVNSYFKQQFFVFLLVARYIKHYQPVVMVNALYFQSRKTSLLNFIDKLLMLLFLIPARQIICNSNGTRNALIRLGLNSDKISVVYPTVVLPPDIPMEPPSSEEFQIAFVGNVTPVKEFHVLIEALSNLLGIPWYLRVAGGTDSDAEYIKEIQKSLRVFLIESKVHFLGRIEGEALTKLYKTSHVLISPGSGEGFGRVVIEAMYFGCPVIGASCEATSELICDRENGLLFEADNPKSLAEKIKYLYEHPKQRTQIIQNAMKSARDPKYYRDIGAQYYKIIQAVSNSGKDINYFN